MAAPFAGHEHEQIAGLGGHDDAAAERGDGGVEPPLVIAAERVGRGRRRTAGGGGGDQRDADAVQTDANPPTLRTEPGADAATHRRDDRRTVGVHVRRRESG